MTPQLKAALREKLDKILAGKSFGYAPWNDNATNRKAKDEILATLQPEIERLVMEERQEIRKLFNKLRMTIGASAGSATGVTVRNDFGESWDFQLDRDALGNLLGRLNSKQLAQHNQEEGKDAQDAL